MTAFDDYTVLLNSKPENETYYECVALTHSLFSAPYYLVRNNVDLQATLHNGQSVLFKASNIAPSRAINSNDLDQSATFTIADVDNILDGEMDRIPLNNQEDIICDYYVFHSKNLTKHVEYISFNVDSVPQKKGSFTVRTGVPDLNRDKTGGLFTFSQFPMLRGL